MEKVNYLFGDSDVAAQRLELVSQVFCESTRAFLLDAVEFKPRLAVDLGCGPGYSTHLLSRVLKCKWTVGLDNSANFFSLAQKTATERVLFYLHDVTNVPFPVSPVDLIYCRFLLTHLKDPGEAISKWATQLKSGYEGLESAPKSTRTDWHL
jgi:trans-aconitate methyltransferase